jgi:hypothetical protein
VTLSPSDTVSQTAAVAALDQVCASGGQYVRVLADWPRLMPSAQQQNFAWLDDIVSAAIARHLTVVLVFGPSPRWTVSYLEEHPTAAEIQRAHPDLPDYRAYVVAVTRHYQRQVLTYQLWSRPSATTLLANPQDVYTLYREGTQAIHMVNPSLQVLAPEPGDLDLGWINGYMKTVTGANSPDALLLSPTSFTMDPAVFALRTQVLRTKILTHTVKPALWADIPLSAQPAQPTLALTAMAMISGCQHLLFPTQSAETLHACTAMVRPLCGQEYAGWVPTTGHCIISAFKAATRQTLLLAPRADEHITVFPAANPRQGELIAQNSAITSTASDGNPIVQPVSDPLSLDVTTGQPHLLAGVTGGVTAGFPDLMPDPIPNNTITLDLSGKNDAAIHPLRDLPGGHYAQYDENGHTILRTISDTMPWIYFDVPASFLFFNTAHVPVEITVQVLGAAVPARTGFNLYYDAINGKRTTHWQWIDVGPDQVFTYTFRLNDALFAKNGGYDFRLQMGGSEESIRVLGVTVKKLG